MTLMRLGCCCWGAAVVLANLAKAGVWGSQPVIGLAGDYYTNPALLTIPNSAESHGDLLLDAPTSYVGNAYKFSVLPSFRFSNAQGYSALDSDYEHLNLINEFDGPLSTLTVNAGASRDSSLYRDYLLDGSTGVRRDGILGDVNWDRQLTERLEFNADGSWTRVQYGHAAGVGTLVDYKYASLAPTLNWLESERAKLTFAAGVGRYDSLNGLTRSLNESAQLGFIDKLTERWTLTAAAGYSHASNSANERVPEIVFTPFGPEIVLVPEEFRSSQNGSVYNVAAERQGERWTLDASVSRQLLPTGFAFLSQQQSYELKYTWNATERWVLSGDVRRLSYRQPEALNEPILDVNISYLTLSAVWQWTEHWTASFMVTRVMEHYSNPSRGLDSSGVSVEVARHFDWKSFR